MKQEYKDDFNNKAIIQTNRVLLYGGAQEKETAFILKCYSLHDNSMYFLSVYETLEDAEQKLATFSCGTFKQVDKGETK